MATLLTDLARELRRFVEAHDRGDATLGMAVIGGLAVSARSGPRFTRDVDLAVSVASDADAEALVHALLARGYRTFAVLEHASGRLSTARFIPPGGAEDAVLVDVLFASCGIEPEVVAAADPVEVLPDLLLPVAQVGHLMAMKLLSATPRRSQDTTDLHALLDVADDAELQRCRDAITLIEARGYNRGRDLHAALATLLALRDSAE